eukprot:2558987-Prymnesium_polylepis.1
MRPAPTVSPSLKARPPPLEAAAAATPVPAAPGPPSLEARTLSGATVDVAGPLAASHAATCWAAAALRVPSRCNLAINYQSRGCESGKGSDVGSCSLCWLSN